MKGMIKDKMGFFNLKNILMGGKKAIKYNI